MFGALVLDLPVRKFFTPTAPAPTAPTLVHPHAGAHALSATQVRVGTDLIGRVVDALGNPIDGGAATNEASGAKMLVEIKAPGA